MTMTTAQKMFEALGFAKVRDDENYIVYINILPECEPMYVKFNKKNEHYMVHDMLGHARYVDNCLHMAITRQIEELRWIF